jgi:site-specific DNA-methyltransferase (adenine-specific)
VKPYYEHGGITIYHGEALHVLVSLETGSADALLTDPPYSSGGMFRSDRTKDPAEKYRGWSQAEGGGSKAPTAEYGTFAGDSRDQRAFATWAALWSAQAHRVCRPGSRAFWFSDWRQLPTVTDSLQAGGWTWRGILAWDKGVGRPVRGRFRNHLEYVAWGSHGAPEDAEGYPSALISVPTVPPNERQHVTQKPVELVRHLLSTCPRPGLVVDPFMGAGSTLVGAKELGWTAIGIEQEERYCEIAARRLSQEVLSLGGVA